MVEGKQVRLNPVEEVVKEMRQLYDRGVRGFWFTDAQFILLGATSKTPRNCFGRSRPRPDRIRCLHPRRQSDPEHQLMVETASYFEIGITLAQELVRKMRMDTTCAPFWRAAACLPMQASATTSR